MSDGDLPQDRFQDRLSGPVAFDEIGTPRSARIGIRASIAVDAIERIVAIAQEEPTEPVLLDADGALGLIQRIADLRRWELRESVDRTTAG